MSALHDDLFQPTLSPDLDVRTFRKPWNPAALTWVALFGLVFGGGLLLAENARRLGRKDEGKRILVRTIEITLLASMVLGVVLMGTGGPVDLSSDTTAGALCGLSFVAFLGAGLVGSRQVKRFAAYRNSGRQPGKLVIPAIAAFFGGHLVHGGLVVACTAAARALLIGSGT